MLDLMNQGKSIQNLYSNKALFIDFNEAMSNKNNVKNIIKQFLKYKVNPFLRSSVVGHVSSLTHEEKKLQMIRLKNHSLISPIFNKLQNQYYNLTLR
jgi:hypothetical protein